MLGFGHEEKKKGQVFIPPFPHFALLHLLLPSSKGRKSQHLQCCCLPYAKPTVIPIHRKLPLTVITEVSDRQPFKRKIPAVPTSLICRHQKYIFFFSLTTAGQNCFLISIQQSQKNTLGELLK